MSYKEKVTEGELFVKLNVDNKAYTKKPLANVVGKICTRMKNKNMVRKLAFNEFLHFIHSGYTFTSAVMHGTKDADWQEQVLFIADIDNEDKNIPMLTIEDCKEILTKNELPFALIYESFQSTKEKPKFRLVLVCDQVVTDRQEALAMNKALVSLFSQADKACTNLGRFYFGTNLGVKSIINKQSFSKDKLLSLTKPNNKNKINIKQEKEDKEKDIASDFGELISNFDLLAYIKQEFNVVSEKKGKDVVINPCPICGHNDDFYVDIERNIFMCHSSSGGFGGNIINLIEATKKVDRKEARKMVLEYNKTKKNEDKQLTPSYIQTYTSSTGKTVSTVMCAVLADYIQKNVPHLYVKNSATEATNKYWYVDGVYRLVNDNQIRNIISNYIPIAQRKTRDIKDIFSFLSYRKEYIPDSALNTDEHLINFKNGILNLNTMELTEHDPSKLMTTQLTCNWNPKPSNNKKVFDTFLNDLTEGNEEKKSLILQFMGAVFSNIHGSRFKKALWVIGKGNTGKSQLKTLIENILGEDSYTAIDLYDLESRFGAASIHNKRLAGSSDMAYQTLTSLSTFKKATGGDSIYAEHKGERAFSFRYKGFLMFCCNMLPTFGGDRGDWVYDRITLIECNNVVAENIRDQSLGDKLYEEREYIVYKAIKELRKCLRINNAKKSINKFRFLLGSDTEEVMDKYKLVNSNIDNFLNLCCYRTQKDDCLAIHRNVLYQKYCSWVKANDLGDIETRLNFKKEVMLKFRCKPVRRRDGEYFTHIALKK